VTLLALFSENIRETSWLRTACFIPIWLHV
jgi:hypothetical protein